MTKLSDITPRQIEQVKARAFGWDDPCIICGKRFRMCPHKLDEAEERIRYIQNMRHADRALVRKREQEKQVATSSEKADQLLSEATALRRQAIQLVQTARELQEQAKTEYQYPKKPAHEFWKISVKFRTSQWNTYTYLVFMPAGSPFIFTTGQDERTTKFKDWHAFVDWLRSDDIVWNGGLDGLNVTGVELKLP